jgi:starch phosphorylase
MSEPTRVTHPIYGLLPSSPVRQEMTRVRQLAGGDIGYAYVAQVPATRPVADYTARVIPRRDGVANPLEDARILW